MLRDAEVTRRRMPVLVMLNKSDGGGSDAKPTITAEAVSKALMLEVVSTTRQVKVVTASAVTQNGVDEGWAWLRAVM